jgi:hypothetical protein
LQISHCNRVRGQVQACDLNWIEFKLVPL